MFNIDELSPNIASATYFCVLNQSNTFPKNLVQSSKWNANNFEW